MGVGPGPPAGVANTSVVFKRPSLFFCRSFFPSPLKFPLRHASPPTHNRTQTHTYQRYPFPPGMVYTARLNSNTADVFQDLSRLFKDETESEIEEAQRLAAEKGEGGPFDRTCINIMFDLLQTHYETKIQDYEPPDQAGHAGISVLHFRACAAEGRQ